MQHRDHDHRQQSAASSDPGGRGDVGGPAQATDGELLLRTVLYPQLIRRCVRAMVGVADRQGKGWPLPICRRLDSLTLKAAAAQHSSVGSLGG
jgi:hypothetical protein